MRDRVAWFSVLRGNFFGIDLPTGKPGWSLVQLSNLELGQMLVDQPSAFEVWVGARGPKTVWSSLHAGYTYEELDFRSDTDSILRSA